MPRTKYDPKESEMAETLYLMIAIVMTWAHGSAPQSSKTRLTADDAGTRKDNGNEVMPFKKLSELIENRFGYKVARNTIGEWIK